MNPVALLSTSAVHFLIIPLWSEYTVEEDSSNSRGSSSLPLLLYHTKHRSTHQPPLVPLRSPSCPPFLRDPCDLCSVTAQRPCSGCQGDDLGGPQTDTHTHTHTHCGKGERSIFYYTEGGEGLGGRGREGARRVALQ